MKTKIWNTVNNKRKKDRGQKSEIKSNVKTSENAHRQSRRLRHKIVIKKDKDDKDKDPSQSLT
jgi:hypothetical protein